MQHILAKSRYHCGLGTAALLGACLLASLSSGAKAEDGKTLQDPANATLAFSPTSVGPGQFMQFCALNLNTVAVTAQFVLQAVDVNANTAILQPGQVVCGPLFEEGGGGAPTVQILASIVLQSPDECSYATEYPGRCRLLASLEVAGATSRIHLEPVLLPFDFGRRIPLTAIGHR
jgi:hypothetical protein